MQTLHGFFLLSALSLSLLAGSTTYATTPASPTESNSQVDEPTCKLTFRGMDVIHAKIYPVPQPYPAPHIAPYLFYYPEKTIQLPPGQYRAYLLLEGGLAYRFRNETIELTPETPYEFVMEGFTYQITAERAGPFLCVDHTGLHDSQGRHYTTDHWSTESALPNCRVTCRDKEIASGTLEYG